MVHRVLSPLPAMVFVLPCMLGYPSEGHCRLTAVVVVFPCLCSAKSKGHHGWNSTFTAVAPITKISPLHGEVQVIGWAWKHGVWGYFLLLDVIKEYLVASIARMPDVCLMLWSRRNACCKWQGPQNSMAMISKMIGEHALPGQRKKCLSWGALGVRDTNGQWSQLVVDNYLFQDLPNHTWPRLVVFSPSMISCHCPSCLYLNQRQAPLSWSCPLLYCRFIVHVGLQMMDGCWTYLMACLRLTMDCVPWSLGRLYSLTWWRPWWPCPPWWLDSLSC